MLPWSFKRVSPTNYCALMYLALIMSMSTSYQLTLQEIDEIEKHLIAFVKWYYDTFYQGCQERLPVCKYTAHALLHIAKDMRNWGPSSYYWQYAEVFPSHVLSLLIYIGTIMWYPC